MRICGEGGATARWRAVTALVLALALLFLHVPPQAGAAAGLADAAAAIPCPGHGVPPAAADGDAGREDAGCCTAGCQATVPAGTALLASDTAPLPEAEPPPVPRHRPLRPPFPPPRG